MTGQLFVVPADAPEDPYVRLVLELADGRELRFRDIRKFGRIGLYGRDPVTGELVAEVGGAAVFAAIGPEPLDDAFTLRDVPAAAAPAQGPAQAAAARPGVPRRRRQHLRRRGAVAVAAPSAALGRDRCASADERRLYEAIRGVLAEAVERRGSSIDDYTAPDGDGSMQERLRRLPADRRAVPALRPADQAHRHRRAVDAFCSWCQRLPGGRPQGRRARSCATMTGGEVRRGRRWTELAPGRGASG